MGKNLIGQKIARVPMYFKSTKNTKQVPVSNIPVMTDERWKALSQKGGAKA